MRTLIHNAAFAVFCAASCGAVIAGVGFLIHSTAIGELTGEVAANPLRAGIAIVCAVTALASYGVGWLTAAEPWDEADR